MQVLPGPPQPWTRGATSVDAPRSERGSCGFESHRVHHPSLAGAKRRRKRRGTAGELRVASHPSTGILRDGRPGLGRSHKPPTACSTHGPATKLSVFQPSSYPVFVRFFQQQDASLTSRRWGCNSLTGHQGIAAVAEPGIRTSPRHWFLEVRILSAAPSFAHPCSGSLLELRVASQHFNGDMGRQRPTCFGNRHRPGASPGSPTTIFGPSGLSLKAHGTTAQKGIRKLHVSRPPSRPVE